MSLPSKIKLSGTDCFHLALDLHSAKHSAGDNMIRMAFHFDENISKEQIQKRLSNSKIVHWLCNVKLCNGNVITSPHWIYTKGNNTIVIREHYSEQTNEIPEVIFNKGISLDSTSFIEADLIHFPNHKSTVVFSWHHIIMDGRGAGMLIKSFDEIESTLTEEILFPKKEKKIGLLAHIRNMYKVKAFIAKSSTPSIVSPAEKKVENCCEFNFKTIYFTAEETRKIEANANKNGDRFGINLFLLAICATIVNETLKVGTSEKYFWVPVPCDTRLRGAKGPIISNNISCLFYRINIGKLKSLKEKVTGLSAQMAEQLKMEMPKKYEMLLNMMRYIPSKLYYHLVNRPGDGAMASFLYTSTGQGINDMKSLLGTPLNDITIYPPKTYPPGLTFAFYTYGNALKLTIAYSTASITSTDIFEVEKKLRQLTLQS